MRRLLAAFLGLILLVGAFPLPSRVGLVCRMTGQPMQAVAVQDNPTSCCAVRVRESGRTELANRSCCDLRITPGHAPLPGAPLAQTGPLVAVLPTLPTLTFLPERRVTTPASVPLRLPRERGPPGRPSVPRAPPTLS